MRLIDANILLYAYDDSSTLHGAAKQWLEKTCRRRNRYGSHG